MRTRSILVAILVLVAAAVAVEALSEVEIEEKPITWTQASRFHGEELYADLCASCHGSDGKGGGPAAEALATPVPDLTDLALRHEGVFPVQEAEEMILGDVAATAEGSREMPHWGAAFRDVRIDFKPWRREALAKRQVSKLVAYLETLQREG